jgi:hypothetical protein
VVTARHSGYNPGRSLFETADLQEAKALLAMLAGSAGYDFTC